MNIYYMNGAGNDFMVMDARDDESRDFSALALEYCKMTGADGFMAVGKSEIADFRLHFYNSDGTRGEMCGNGARCICRFAHDMGIAGAEMTVQTDAGIVPGWRIDENQYRVKLNNPSILDLNRKGDIIDTSPVVHDHGGTVLLGEPDSAYGKNLPDGLRFITVSNVICGSKRAVRVSGYLWDSVISNIVNRNPGCEALIVEKEDGLRNVLTNNLLTVSE